MGLSKITILSDLSVTFGYCSRRMAIAKCYHGLPVKGYPTKHANIIWGCPFYSKSKRYGIDFCCSPLDNNKMGATGHNAIFFTAYDLISLHRETKISGVSVTDFSGHNILENRDTAGMEKSIRDTNLNA